MDLKSVQKKVVLVSSGQPSLNPRLVKEADALVLAGYQVTVLYAHWNSWGTEHDNELFKEKQWKAVRIGGSPEAGKVTYFFSRVIHKISRLITQKTGCHHFFAECAMSRSSFFLMRSAKKYKADLYIAHNLGALPATVKAATFNNKPAGFDAEDFHRKEVNDDERSFYYQIAKYLEDKYLPKVSYITASSPLIGEKYASLYNREVGVLLNVFPKSGALNYSPNNSPTLKLFWFSQTIGPSRGLETIIESMALMPILTELHLLGNTFEDYEQQLMLHAQKAGVPRERFFFYEPIKAEQIFALAAQFDVGLTSETGFCKNNRSALTNKMFTYIQSGLAVVMSNTPAQSRFMKQYPQIGKIYNNNAELAQILTAYHQNRELLNQAKEASYRLGQDHLNWENEGQKFLAIVNETLAKFE